MDTTEGAESRVVHIRQGNRRRGRDRVAKDDRHIIQAIDHKLDSVDVPAGRRLDERGDSPNIRVGKIDRTANLHGVGRGGSDRGGEDRDFFGSRRCGSGRGIQIAGDRGSDRGGLGAHIADSVTIRIGLVEIGDQRTVVEIVRYGVEIGVIGNRRWVGGVTAIADAIAISVGLVWIRDGGTVVVLIGNAVHIGIEGRRLGHIALVRRIERAFIELVRDAVYVTVDDLRFLLGLCLVLLNLHFRRLIAGLRGFA